MLYAKKTIKSGRMLEDIYYPILPSGRSIPYAEKQPNPYQEAYDRKQAAKSLTRTINANFDTGDLFVHLTYFPERAPESYEEAKKAISKYFRRVEYWRKKHGLPKGKYAYVIEEQIYKSGKRKGKSNWHYHIFMSGMPRDVAEDLWKDGERVNADRFQPDRFGQEAAANYIQKAPRGRKKFICSRNCIKPKISEPKRMDISNRKMRSMCEVYAHDSAYWERNHPGYKFDYSEPYWNEYNCRWYLRVVMRKLEPRHIKKRNQKKKRRE